MIQEIISNIDDIVWGPQFVILFVLLAIYLTIKLKVPQIKTILAIFKVKNHNKDGVSSFKALMTILAGTLGIGNITGVATAILIGGVGSIFWIFISGVFAMAISYAENYLVLKYRKFDKHKGFFGGSMYILDGVMNKRGIAITFAIFTLFATVGMGAMVQSNSLAVLLNEQFRIEKSVVGVLMIILSSYIIFGGKYRMAKVNSYIIPFCTLTYIGLCLVILLNNTDGLVKALSCIVSSAFGVKQVVGAATGVGIIKCISVGFSRGMFSNEAGMGSAPIFAATTEDSEDIKTTSYIMSYSVFIDTVLLCTLTGLTIVCAGTYTISNIPIMLERTFGTIPFGNFLLTICITVFVVATIPCWEFYGEQTLNYLLKSGYSIYLYKIIYIFCVYIGCILSLEIVWDLSNISNALMALPNIYMIFCLKDEIEG